MTPDPTAKQARSADTRFAKIAIVLLILLTLIGVWLARDQIRLLSDVRKLQTETLSQTITQQKLARNVDELRRQGERVLSADTPAERAQALVLVNMVANSPGFAKNTRISTLTSDTERFLNTIDIQALSGMPGAATRAEWHERALNLSHLAGDISSEGLHLGTNDLKAMEALIEQSQNKLLTAILAIVLFMLATLLLIRRQFVTPLQRIYRSITQIEGSASREDLPGSDFKELQSIESAICRLRDTLKYKATIQGELAQRDNMLRTILETSLDGFWRVDMQGRLAEINPTYCRQSGYGHDELLSMHIPDLDASESPAEVEARIRRIIETGNEQFESRHRRKDGSIWDVEVSATYSNTAGGQFYVFLRDITERKQMESILQRNIVLLRHITDKLDQVFFMAAADYSRFSFISTAFDHIWGRPRALLMESPKLWIDWLHPDDRNDVIQFVTENPGKQSYSSEFRIVRPDGEVRWIHAHAFSLPSESGREQVIGYQSDITLQKQAEAEILAAKQLAEAANQSKSHFLAAASHDLRQPMQAINLFVDALARTELSEDQKPLTRYLMTATQVLGELLNSLLDLSKLDAGMVNPKLANIQVNALLTMIDAGYSVVAARKSLRFKLSFPFADMAVSVDTHLLMRLLGNLIDNAIKHTEQGGILVAIRRRGKQALIQVWDTGIGIAPEHQDRIFEEYFQVGNPERDSSKGLGLGLAITQRIAKLLGTEVVCRSRLGKGSVFEFRLPLAPSEENTRSSRSEQPEVTTLAKPAPRHVVVLEDNLMVSIATKMALESCGMSVTHYKTAEEALADAGITDADFYITDLWLPGMSGIEFLEALQRRTAKPIKAAISTGDLEATQDEHLRASSWQVLFKPVDLDSLVSAIWSQDLGD
jgi:PAS domain S-box-containing protein